MFFDQIRTEAIMPCRYRGVSGEHHLARDAGHGDVETDAFFLHASADRFEDGEAAVAFVQVKTARVDAHGFEGAEASDSQKELLADAGARISAIEAGREFAGIRRIAFNNGGEQE